MSPMITSFANQKYEDRNKSKRAIQSTENINERNLRSQGTAKGQEINFPRENKDLGKTMKIGPPVQGAPMAKRVAFIEPNEEESERLERPVSKFRKVPYVDVPPLKATLRSKLAENVNQDQSSIIGPVYKTKAPVEIGVDIEKLVETVLDLEINIPLRSLAGVSSAVQKEIKKQVTKTKMPTETAKTNLLIEEDELNNCLRVETLPIATYMIMTEVSDEIPEGHLVASDPVLQYLMKNDSADPGHLIIAKPSEPLRAIYAMINRVGQEECLLDSGSMIVSMAKEVAIQLGLTWDPSITINMESASNHLEKTLGLARNVRFAVGGLDLFLQVHILEAPPYRILLGRPFDTFTSSVVKTKPDGSSEITLIDPNSKMTAVVPTYQREISPDELQKQHYQGF